MLGELDMVQTLAFAGIVLFVGYALRSAVPILSRYNLPAPVIGGMIVSIGALIAHESGYELAQFDNTLREPLMIAFFSTIGFGASYALLKRGGPYVLLFFGLSTLAAILQNVVGATTAFALGQPPLLGVLCGSVTLTGGPATGLAFADQFENAGVAGAEVIAITAAMMGIVAGGLIGTPIGTLLIDRWRRAHPAANAKRPNDTLVEVNVAAADSTAAPAGDEDPEAYQLLKSLTVILLAMWIGSWVGVGLSAMRIRMPAYIGAMFVAAAIRNLDDCTGWLRLSQRVIDVIGQVALSFFLVLALMSLELWRLSSVALPLVVLLAVQIILIVILSIWLAFAWMGRDYDAAVMSSGFIGFMMGTTANAMANMDSLVQRYGAAPRAYLVVPMVGAFFIDFTNALLIQGCLNLFG